MKTLNLAKRNNEKQNQLIQEWLREKKNLHKAINFALKEDRENKNFAPFWHLDHFFIENEEYIAPFINRLLDCLEQVQHSGCKRSILRPFSIKKRKLNTTQASRLIHFCLKILTDKDEAIAVQASSFRILGELLPDYPELAQEIEEIMEGNTLQKSYGMQVRIREMRKVIQKLKKIN